MKSIRTQIARQILGGAAVIFASTGGILLMVIHARLVAQFDGALEARADALKSLTSRENRILDMDYGAAEPDREGGQAEQFFQVFLPDGTVLRKSASLGENDLPLNPQPADKETFRNVRLHDGRHIRLLQLFFEPEAEEPEPDEAAEIDDPDSVTLPAHIHVESLRLVLVVASGRERLDAMVTSLCLTLGALGILLLGSLTLVVRRAIRTGFAPIDAMNAQIARIGPDSLGDRVQVAAPPAELAASVSALNELLDRLRDAFSRERRFASDVAHELRTPVSELRSACEVGAKWPDDPASVRIFFEDIREIALQMQRTVADLLLLARAGSEPVAIVRRRIELHCLVDACWGSVHAEAAKKKLRLENNIDPAFTMESDPERLRIIVQNLVDNAIAYGVPGTAVECAGATANSEHAFLIANRVHGLAPDDVQHVFERFWRKDPARADRDHSGLGLSIVQSLADLLGLHVQVDLKDGTIFEVRVVFPTS